MNLVARYIPTNRLRHVATIVVALIAIVVVIAALLRNRTEPIDPESEVTIGVEGHLRVKLPSDSIAAVPYSHGDAVALRVSARSPVADGTNYDLAYIAYGPGTHDLGKFLVDENQKPISGLEELTVSVDALLEPEESGQLAVVDPLPVELRSNYQLVMNSLWIVWTLAIVPIWVVGRVGAKLSHQSTPKTPTVVRLRTLLQKASVDPVDSEQKAEIEALFLSYWAEQLGIDKPRMFDRVQRLRSHDETKRQMQLLERWLHDADHSRSEADSETRMVGELLKQLDVMHGGEVNS